MLTELYLRDYRCFRQHKLSFKDLTIVVGRNNAGKSTVVEALRLVAMVTGRLSNLAFRPVPKWSNFPRVARGVSPSVASSGLFLSTVFHNYGEPPAGVKAVFSGGESVEIEVGPDSEVFAVLQRPDGAICKTAQEAKALGIVPVSILPQIRPLDLEEGILQPDYVRRMTGSRLSSSHFRNQLLLDPGGFEEFRDLVERTWPGVGIQSLESQGRASDKDSGISLLIREAGFVAEVAWLGHGIQMWLQTMWFFVRASESQTLILDEPDVYMHPDLQRRLVKLAAADSRQVVVTTHSTEIMAEANPENILVVDRSRAESCFATSIPSVQLAVERLGGSQNLALARLWMKKKCLLVEGKDLALLGPIYSTLFPDDLDGIGSLPSFPIGGWSGWPYAVGSSMFAEAALGTDVDVYCILDRDYHLDAEIEERQAQAIRKGIRLKVWARKEVENYLLVPEAIHRLISANIGPDALELSEVESRLLELADDFRAKIEESFVTAIHLADRKQSAGTAARKARKYVDDRWGELSQRLQLVPGKQMVSSISKWSQETFGVSISSRALAHTLTRSEVCEELLNVLAAIKTGRPFD
ncbi:MAG: AAA family ATPase [Myxococcota bacterium]